MFIFTAAAQTASTEIVDEVCFNSQLSKNLLSFIASPSLPLVRAQKCVAILFNEIEQNG